VITSVLEGAINFPSSQILKKRKIAIQKVKSSKSYAAEKKNNLKNNVVNIFLHNNMQKKPNKDQNMIFLGLK
jgi:hypothetical protein